MLPCKPAEDLPLTAARRGRPRRGGFLCFGGGRPGTKQTVTSDAGLSPNALQAPKGCKFM